MFFLEREVSKCVWRGLTAVGGSFWNWVYSEPQSNQVWVFWSLSTPLQACDFTVGRNNVMYTFYVLPIQWLRIHLPWKTHWKPQSTKRKGFTWSLSTQVFPNSTAHWIVLVAQSCLTLCNPTDRSLPGSSVHRILQAGILEWVVIPFSRWSSWSRDWTLVSCIEARFFTIWATREPLNHISIKNYVNKKLPNAFFFFCFLFH